MLLFEGIFCIVTCMNIPRYIDIDTTLRPGSALVLLGPRRSGKTTLLTNFLKTTNRKVAFYRGDEMSVQHNFSIADSAHLAGLVGDNEVLAIDEAQMIPRIGNSLKLLIDTQPELSIVVTGSSAFELNGQLGEPLTGRKHTRYLLPISLSEYAGLSSTPRITIADTLESLLIYGMYPSTLTADTPSAKVEYLSELINSYLLKDILTFQEVKGSRKLLQLLVLLSHQIGSEVSLTELGTSLEIDRKTVERYLDLLEKTYVIFRLGGYSRNLRSEVTKMAKYYFYDNGVRNALINNFNALEIRDDIGKLWENYTVSERYKRRLYYGPRANQYFWRTWKGGEIDLIEERDGKLYGYEMKWSARKKPLRSPTEWTETYGTEATWQCITPDELYDFTVTAC